MVGIIILGIYSISYKLNFNHILLLRWIYSLLIAVFMYTHIIHTSSIDRAFVIKYSISKVVQNLNKCIRSPTVPLTFKTVVLMKWAFIPQRFPFERFRMFKCKRQTRASCYVWLRKIITAYVRQHSFTSITNSDRRFLMFDLAFSQISKTGLETKRRALHNLPTSVVIYH